MSRWSPLLLLLATSTAAAAAPPVPGLPDAVIDEVASAVVARPGDGALAAVTVHTENDAAFRAKLAVVQTAIDATDPAERHLRLAYYIFAEDETASKLQTELIRAARAGVKVDLLVDLWSNYAALDRFRMLEREANVGNSSGGSLTVRYYGRPSRNLMLDAAWLTTGCGDHLKKGLEGGQVAAAECARAKAPELDAFVAKAEDSPEGRRLRALNLAVWNTGGSGAFLSGLYAKSGDVLATSVLSGAGFTADALGGDGPGLDDAKKAALIKFAKLLADAKLSGDPFVRLGAMAQLELAFLFYGKQVNPVYNAFTGVFPIDTKRLKAYRAGGGADHVNDDRDYSTEFTHHKLILAGGTHWVVGGRNVDNAYNIGVGALSGRITFIDTSIETTLAAPSPDMPAAFDRLFGFEEMVIGTDDLLRTMPNDIVADAAMTWERCADRAGWTVWTKKEVEVKAAIKACVDAASEEYETSHFPVAERLDHHRDHMLAMSAAWDAHEQAPVMVGDEPYFPSFVMSAADRATARVAFVENLPYSRDSYTRHYGATVEGKRALPPSAFGKNIHEVLIRGMEQACVDAQAEPEGAPKVPVILYNAYFSPPSPLVRAMSNMVDGTWDCGNVALTVLTNSPETTDLRGVNLLGNEAMAAFEDYRQPFLGSPTAATVRVLSLDKARLDARLAPPEKRDGVSEEPSTLSLHSKVAVLGRDTILVGSANADFRSYLMDTNDAMVVTGAPELVTTFTTWLEGRYLAPGGNTTRIVRDAPDRFGDHAVTRLDNLNALLLDVQKYGVAKAQDPSRPMAVERAETELGYRLVNCADGRKTCAEIQDDLLPLAIDYLDHAYACTRDAVDAGTSGTKRTSECRAKMKNSSSDKARRMSQQALDDFYKTI